MGITVDKELVKKIYEDGYIDPKSFKSVTESVCGSLIHIKFRSEAQKAQFLFFYGSVLKDSIFLYGTDLQKNTIINIGYVTKQPQTKGTIIVQDFLMLAYLNNLPENVKLSQSGKIHLLIDLPFKHANFLKQSPNLFLVGGAIRDYLLDTSITDYDYCFNGSYNDFMNITTEIRSREQSSIYGGITVSQAINRHNTVVVREVSGSFRAEVTPNHYLTIKEDVLHRDFTCNALYTEITEGSHSSILITDIVGGLHDIKNNILRFVGSPKQRIVEDPLRILRFFRFQVQLGFTPYNEEKVLQTIKNSLKLLKTVPKEQIWNELVKIILYSKNKTIFDKMDSIGLFNYLDIPYNGSLYRHSNHRVMFFVPMMDSKQWSNFSTVYKLSTEDAKFGHYLIKNKDICHTKKSLMDQLADGVNPSWVLDCGKMFLIHSKKQQILFELQRFDPNSFPIVGDDLLNLGYSGKGLGMVLKSIKDLWKDSYFKLSKKELLRTLQVKPIKDISQLLF